MIDAVLGTGFNGVLQGVQQRVCGLMNSIAVPVVSIDVPSGVSADTGSADKNAVQADITVTMALAKPGLFLYPAVNHKQYSQLTKTFYYPYVLKVF